VRDVRDRPIEYIRVLYRPDLYRFEMSMRRVQEKDGARWTTTTSSPFPDGAGKVGTSGQSK
jgi:GntR family transcriptional regulator